MQFVSVEYQNSMSHSCHLDQCEPECDINIVPCSVPAFVFESEVFAFSYQLSLRILGSPSGYGGGAPVTMDGKIVSLQPFSIVGVMSNA